MFLIPSLYSTWICIVFVLDPKKIAYIQETVGETSSQSVVVAVDRWIRRDL